MDSILPLPWRLKEGYKVLKANMQFWTRSIYTLIYEYVLHMQWHYADNKMAVEVKGHVFSLRLEFFSIIKKTSSPIPCLPTVTPSHMNWNIHCLFIITQVSIMIYTHLSLNHKLDQLDWSACLLFSVSYLQSSRRAVQLASTNNNPQTLTQLRSHLPLHPSCPKHSQPTW